LVYITHLNVLFSKDLKDGKITANQLSALAETLTYVDDEEVGSQMKLSRPWQSPRGCYTWALARASIAFPSISLDVAAEKIKSLLTAGHTWGRMSDGKILLPRPESTPDSNAWNLIREILRIRYGEILSEEGPHDETVPTLSNDEIIKKPALEHLLIRILQLTRNPASATLRRSAKMTVDELVRNATDFVVLDQFYQKHSEYQNLNVSDFAVSMGRRSQKQEITIGSKRTATIGNISVGYKLSDYLAQYLTKITSKSLENEPFIQLILHLLRDISLEIPSEWELPKIFLEAPSVQLRSSVRQGPSIKTKKGVRANLYVPLSFVKSVECEFMDESTKRELTTIGASVIQKLDECNHLPIKRASEVTPFLKEYIAQAYIFSDTCRKEWRRNAYVPSSEPIRKALVEDFPDLDSCDLQALDSYIQKLRIKVKQLTFSPVSNDKLEMARIKETISNLHKSKSGKRG
jgi:hypothetical protein